MVGLLDKINKLGLKMTIGELLLKCSPNQMITPMSVSRVAKIDSKIGATVYRTIKLFGENNIIEKHDFKRTEDLDMNKFQMSTTTTIDVKNDKVIEFQNDEIEKLPLLRLGYKLVDHRLELYAVQLKEKINY